MDWVWPRNLTRSVMRPQVNKMSWNQFYRTSLLAQGLGFAVSSAGVARVWSLAGKWRSHMPGGTAKNFKINKYKFLKMKLIFTKDNLELQWPQWRTFNHLRWPYPVTRCPREKGLSQALTMKGQERVTFPPLRFLVTRMRPTWTSHLLWILQTALWENWQKPGKG